VADSVLLIALLFFSVGRRLYKWRPPLTTVGR